MNLSLLGHFFIKSALIIALLQGCLPLLGYWRKNLPLLALAAPLAILQCLFITNAFFLLMTAFITNDFSLAYVAQNSHPALPFFYRLTAIWGAHEGSFLLWIFLINIWTLSIYWFSTAWPKELRCLTLALLGFMSFCFLLFLFYTSHPFKTGVNTLPQDLNPLLQDPGFFIHPPLLYAGYVGFSVVFAITMAYLIQGPHSITPNLWATLIRPWVVAAWSFLTLGITLGSWWAYHVLGWGGFWFWDPVENASLLPWLSGAALLHVIIIVEKQARFNDWAIILAIISFSLSILGTFLVRSGVLISVHSFANDPSRGLFLLLLLAGITGSALAVYMLRRLFSPQLFMKKSFWSLSSREGILLTQSIFLFIAMSTILLGTLYPLIIQALGLGSLSVGAPYFNQVLFPLLLFFLVVMSLAPFSQWQKVSRLLNRTNCLNLVFSLILAYLFSRLKLDFTLL